MSDDPTSRSRARSPIAGPARASHSIRDRRARCSTPSIRHARARAVPAAGARHAMSPSGRSPSLPCCCSSSGPRASWNAAPLRSSATDGRLPPPRQAPHSRAARAGVEREPRRERTPAPSASPVVSDTPGSSAPARPARRRRDPVLVGAGDIADCGTDGDEATAALLDGIAGTVFTAGDNAYERGDARRVPRVLRRRPGVAIATGPGRRPATTTGKRPVSMATGLLRGGGQGPGGSSWYSYDLGAWHIIVLDSMCDMVGGCGPTRPRALARGRPRREPTPCARWRSSITRASAPASTATKRRWMRSGVRSTPPMSTSSSTATTTTTSASRPRIRMARPTRREASASSSSAPAAPLCATSREWPQQRGTARRRHGVIEFTLHESSYDAEFIAAGNDFRDVGADDCH